MSEPKVHYEVLGEGPPLVMIHGLGGTINFYEPIVERLATTHRVIRYDFNGHGRSPLEEPITVEGLADQAAALIDELADGQAHVVAHSMGTLIAQHLGAAHPDKVASMVLLGPVTAQHDAARRATRERAATVRATGMGAVADAIVRSGTAPTSRAANALVGACVREMLTRQVPENYAQACEALASAEDPDLSPVAGRVLLLTGSADAVGKPEIAQELATRFTDAECHVIEDIGHWTVIEAPGEVLRAIEAFLG
ncbi:alpha/beta fold hydrolase [Raineyella fluvialis]|uniref:Alpha/beta fold hydrolase n=1 Tax=Raineyella fluvialis TaxID=2662261 RepID=A0A5Q2FEB4_9ACTN|nr:alpha/beta fold hydrolase [Raineyella fluvialis]